jgi:signal peptidase I
MRAFRDILNIIFIPALLIAIPYICFCIPVFWGYIPFEVTFDSMNPSFQDGELVYYNLVNKSDLQVNDLVVYYDSELENNRIFHRIVEVRDDGLITKGDAKEFNDPDLLLYENVIGKVSNIKLPAVGPYVKFANSNIMFIYGAIAIWGLYFLVSFLIVKKDMKTKKLAKRAALAANAPVQAAPVAPVEAPVAPAPVAPAPVVQAQPVTEQAQPVAPATVQTTTAPAPEATAAPVVQTTTAPPSQPSA